MSLSSVWPPGEFPVMPFESWGLHLFNRICYIIQESILNAWLRINIYNNVLDWPFHILKVHFYPS